MNITELVEKAHANAVDKGFWDEKRETGTLLALIHSEVSEALEADRNSEKSEYVEVKLSNVDYSNLISFLTSYGFLNMVVKIEKGAKFINPKENFAEELADILIRVFDLSGGKGIDLESAVMAKMERNRQRPRLHGKQY